MQIKFMVSAIEKLAEIQKEVAGTKCADFKKCKCIKMNGDEAHFEIVIEQSRYHLREFEKLIASIFRILEPNYWETWHGRENSIWPIWKTIKSNIEDFDADIISKKLSENNYSISDDARKLARYYIAKSEEEIKLVLLTMSDLSFDKPTLLSKIYSCDLKYLGLQLCPSWVGPQLRLQYDDQPDGENLYVITDEMSTCNDQWQQFILRNDICLELSSTTNLFLSPEDRIVLALAK